MLEMVTASPWLTLTVVVAVFLGAMVQNTLGIGFGMVASPALLVLEPRLVPALAIMLGFSSSCHDLFVSRQQLDMRHCTYSAMGRMLGTVLGVATLVFLVTDTASRTFALVFASLLLVSVAMSLAGRHLRIFRITTVSLLFFSSISGLFGTLISVGGPPIALLYQNERPEFARPHLQFNISIGSLFAMIGLSLGGFVESLHVLSMALLLPVVVLGVWLTRRFKHLVKKNYRNYILGIVTVSATFILSHAL